MATISADWDCDRRWHYYGVTRSILDGRCCYLWSSKAGPNSPFQEYRYSIPVNEFWP